LIERSSAWFSRFWSAAIKIIESRVKASSINFYGWLYKSKAEVAARIKNALSIIG
jgi:hypothetical protein